MKGDFTRRTFKPQKHYSSVQMQQGRVQLDSDWNEEVAIIDHRWRATLEDTVGPSGAPKAGAGFQLTSLAIQNLADFAISPGRIYVDGILCELDAPSHDATVTGQLTLSIVGLQVGETTLAMGSWIMVSDLGGSKISWAYIWHVDPPAAGTTASSLSLSHLDGVLPAALGTRVRVSPIVTYLTQPDLPSPPQIVLDVPLNSYLGKTYVAYLDVFQRHLTAIDDPAIREVALNGPDTGTRTRTTWQVRMVEVDSMSKCSDVRLPADPNPPAGQFTPPFAGTARMRARAVPTSDPTQDCLLPAEAGFRRLENQLYRVEIHEPGTYASAKFKWSRDNGSVAVAWTGAPTPTEISIVGTPQDSAQGFASGQWVELVDDGRELSPDGTVVGTFVQLGVPNGDTLTIDPLTATGTLDFTQFAGHRKVRRWESRPRHVNDVGTDLWITLEDGVEIQFDAGDPNAWFNKGDYWLIPARTATTDVEWPNDPPGVPMALRAHGVEHRYCALALIQVHSGGQVTTLDCRPQFPSLTTIAASDVSYDNSSCQLINATTVQQAIDALCKARDLAHHNRLIHGYGIVCGLHVECNSTQGRWVTVKKGYAIDCNGNDVEIVADLPVSVDDLLTAMSQSPLDEKGNGAISLMIGLDQHALVKVTAEPYQEQAELEEIFGGTLLVDLYEDCIKPVQLFMKAELAQLPGDAPITGGEELASAFVDLLAQGPNPQAGQNVYISSKEHQLLSTFYADLKTHLMSDLGSHTFCGLLDGARPYPSAAADGTMPHIFGTGQQTRMKWRTGTNEIFTIANGNDPTNVVPRINRYNADTGALIAQIDPTGGASTGPIVDFTFDFYANTIYVILQAANHTDTLYRTGTITNTGVNWTSQLITLSGMRLSAIEGFYAPSPQRLIAVENGVGARVFDPATITSSPAQPALNYPFHASGQLAVNDMFGGTYGLALAAVPFNDSTSSPTTTYNKMKMFVFDYSGDSTFDITLPSSGSDGVAWGGLPYGIDAFVVTGDASKSVTGYTWNFFANTWSQINDVTGHPMNVPVDSCPIRLAGTANVNNLLFWSSQDFYTLNLIDLDTHQAVNGWSLPMQVGPIDMDFAFWRNELAVLHRPSDSILRVQQALIGKTPQIVASTQTVFNNAVAYHTPAVEAYVDLLAAFVQSLKDCVFDHLAVNCAECNPRNQKLYLGTMSIRNWKVHNICNFSQRHYLKTFPTIGYWLSLFPILPIFSEIIEMVSCFVIPDAAAGYKGATYQKPLKGTSADYSLSSMFETLQNLQKMDIRGQLTQMLKTFGLAANMVSLGAGFKATAKPPAQPSAPGSRDFLVGASTTTARGALSQMGMTAETKTFQPSLGPQLLANLVDVLRPPAGPTQTLTLHEAGGQVLFTSSPSPAQPDVASLQQQIQAKDVQLQQMQAQLSVVSTQLTELHAFRQQVTAQLATLPPKA